MSPTLIVLAAGMSTRFAPGSKQLARVGPSGETLIDYGLYDAVLAGFGSAVIVVRPELHAAATAQFARWSARLPVHVAEQSLIPNAARPAGLGGRVRPLGTVHAALCASALVTGPFAIMNADDYYGPDAFYRLAEAMAAPRDSTGGAAVRGWLAGYRLGDTLSTSGGVTRAVCAVAADGHLESIEEAYDVRLDDGRITGGIEGRRQQLHGDSIVSTNLWGFEHAAFGLMQDALDSFIAAGPRPDAELRIADAVTGWLESGTMSVRVLPTTATWFGLTYEEDVPGVTGAIASLVSTHAYPVDLLENSTSETYGSIA